MCFFFYIWKIKKSIVENKYLKWIPFEREIKKECIVSSKFYVKSKFVSCILLQKKKEREVFKDDWLRIW